MLAIKPQPWRQRIRQALLLVSFLAFPITLYYFSPYVIVASAAEGIVNASFIVFGLMFLSALFLGRAWCGWVCPAGALGEYAFAINNKRAPGRKLDWIKWAIWIPWITIIATMAVSAGGYRAVRPFYMLDGGVALNQPYWYMIFYIVIGVFLALSVVLGRRAGCHTICWMAPFVILGRWLRNRLPWPALRLIADSSRCRDCLRCSRDCPMSLDVHHMVQFGHMENVECILCGRCVDGCSHSAIHFSFSGGK